MLIEKLPKPEWLRIRISQNNNFNNVNNTLTDLGLVTVCEESSCPNISTCWDGGTATFMILGDTCTRACKFCHVKTGYTKNPPDHEEPEKLVKAAKRWNLNYVVITSVDRDDLPDQGSTHFAQCIKKLKAAGFLVEALIPDFRGDKTCLQKIVNANPDVIAHNIETIKRLQKSVRDPRANYQQSLHVLKEIKKINSLIYTKSSIMVGLGETKKEILTTLGDLRKHQVDAVTLGQYLQPSAKHLPVKNYVHPDTFHYYKKKALKRGFLYCAAGPFVRSSYKAGEFFMHNILKNKFNLS